MKRPRRPDLPLVYAGMRVTVATRAGVVQGRITGPSGGRRIQFRPGSGGGAAMSFLRRDYRKLWVMGWDTDEANAFRAERLLLKD